MSETKNPGHMVILVKFSQFLESFMNSSLLMTMPGELYHLGRLQRIQAESRVKILLLLDILREMIIPEKEKKETLEQIRISKDLHKAILERTNVANPQNDDVYKKMNALIEELQKSEPK